MKNKGTLVVVKDCHKSLEFYKNVLGLELIQDNDGNMELSGGIFLQEFNYWKKFIGQEIVQQSNSSELYFEESDIDSFVARLDLLYPDTKYVNKPMTHSWGQRVVRFYDLDGNLIEVGTPLRSGSNNTEKKRVFAWMCALTALAGCINALAVKLFITTVSHMTGLVSNAAISIFDGDILNAIRLLSIVGTFLLGAIISAYITGERQFLIKPVYGYIVIAIGALLLVGTHVFDPEGKMIILLLALLMGIQNGMIVSFKGVLVRMTHMTGYITDFGVYLGYKLRGIHKENRWIGIVPFCGIVVFVLGGIFGVWVYSKMGLFAFDVVSFLYIILGIVYLIYQKFSNDKNLDGIPDDSQLGENGLKKVTGGAYKKDIGSDKNAKVIF